jgi:hypothetical protein
MDPSLPPWLYRSEAFVEDLHDHDDASQRDDAGADVAAALVMHRLLPQKSDRLDLPGWMLPALATVVTLAGPIWALAGGL